jgi:hypothetical protein
MANVWVALSGDHGVAPVPAVAAQLGMPAATVDFGKLIAALETRLNQHYSAGKSTRYILGGELPYIELDPRAFAAVKIPEEEAEKTVAEMLPEALESILPAPPPGVSQTRLPPVPVIRRVYTRVDMAAGQLPATEEGRLILHSYSPNGEWYIMLTPGMYELSSSYGGGTGHFTLYSYDRHVPLAFYGSAFVPGTYHDRVAPVDIAATFASLLRINQPTASVGHVLTMAIRNESGTVTARPAPKPAAVKPQALAP